MVALLGLEDQRRIPIRERETVRFSLRTLWRIFVVFCHDIVVDFCLNTKDSRVLGRGCAVLDFASTQRIHGFWERVERSPVGRLSF